MNITERLFKEFLIKRGETNLTIELKRINYYYPEKSKHCLKIHVVGNFNITTKPIPEFVFMNLRNYVRLNTILRVLKTGGYIKSDDINAFTLLYNIIK